MPRLEISIENGSSALLVKPRELNLNPLFEIGNVSYWLKPGPNAYDVQCVNDHECVIMPPVSQLASPDYS
jgi:hypothetical protein